MKQELLPPILAVVDTWFAQFTSIPVALTLLDEHTNELCSANNPSPRHEDLTRRLRERLTAKSQLIRRV